MAAERNSPRSPVRVRAEERALQAVELRAEGFTLREIGARMGMSAEGARAAIKRALRVRVEEIAERADELRALEAAKLDRASAALWPRVTAGEVRATEAWLRTRQRYAALLGLDLAREREPDAGPQIQAFFVGLPQDDPTKPRQDVVDGEASELPEPGIDVSAPGDPDGSD